MCKYSEKKFSTLPIWVFSIQVIGSIVILHLICGPSLVCSAYTPEHIACSICLTVVICLFMILQTILTSKIIEYKFELQSHLIELNSEEKKEDNTVN